MLLSIGRRRYQAISERDSIHNYYEQMVIDQILRSSDRAVTDTDFLADVACVALNRLPPRYVRHDVDMTFFLTPAELDTMVDKVVHSVNDALTYVESRNATGNDDGGTDDDTLTDN